TTGAQIGSLPAVQDPLFACNQGTRTRLRGDVAHQPGCESELGVRVLGLAWERWENLHDYGKARVSGVRQNHLLPASVGPGQMATAGVSSGPDAGPRRHA